MPQRVDKLEIPVLIGGPHHGKECREPFDRPFVILTVEPASKRDLTVPYGEEIYRRDRVVYAGRDGDHLEFCFWSHLTEKDPGASLFKWLVRCGMEAIA